jgi:bifunctional non-homologous end joining protein LigD
MLVTLVKEPFDDPNWIFEDKLDGLRVICRFDGRRLTMLSRNDLPQEAAFPEIVAGFKQSLRKPAILDGEIVCFDEHGHASFRKLQQRFHITDEATVKQRAKLHPAFIYLFDILYFDRHDVRDLPLKERKSLLRKAITQWRSPILWTKPTRGKGVAMFDETCARHGEGIVAKRLDSAYVDYRSGAWLKIKCSGRQEFVIAGFTDPQKSRVGLGALLVGYNSDDGKDLVFAGKVGTGFTNEMLIDLRKRLDRLEMDHPPFTKGKILRGDHVHWVKPKLVAEIAYAEWTQHDLLRQPKFEGLREDKAATSVVREKPINPSPAKTKIIGF